MADLFGTQLQTVAKRIIEADATGAAGPYDRSKIDAEVPQSPFKQIKISHKKPEKRGGAWLEVRIHDNAQLYGPHLITGNDPVRGVLDLGKLRQGKNTAVKSSGALGLSSGDRDLDVIEGGVHAEPVAAGSVPIRA